MLREADPAYIVHGRQMQLMAHIKHCICYVRAMRQSLRWRKDCLRVACLAAKAAFKCVSCCKLQVAYVDMDTLWLDGAVNLWREIESMEAKGAYFGMADEVTEANGNGSYYKTGAASRFTF